MPVRIPERVLEWRDRQREGSIMSPSTFRSIQHKARVGGYSDPSSVAGKSYWMAVLSKYLDIHPDDQGVRRILRAFSVGRRSSLRRNILISEELVSSQDPEIAELLRRLKSGEVTLMQAKLIRRKLRKKGFRLRQHVGGVPRKVKVRKPRGPLLLPYYPRGATEAAGEHIAKLKRKGRRPITKSEEGLTFVPTKKRYRTSKLAGALAEQVIGRFEETGGLRLPYPKKRVKLLPKNWVRPSGTSFTTPFDDAADLLEQGHSPLYILDHVRAKWKMTPVEFKIEVVRRIHKDPALSAMWMDAIRDTSSEGMNPPKMKVIYDNVLAIEAQKGSESHFPKERFRHDFGGATKARVIGLPDGSLLIKSKKRLWKEFDY
jgi:hypothetical protein